MGENHNKESYQQTRTLRRFAHDKISHLIVRKTAALFAERYPLMWNLKLRGVFFHFGRYAPCLSTAGRRSTLYMNSLLITFQIPFKPVHSLFDIL